MPIFLESDLGFKVSCCGRVIGRSGRELKIGKKTNGKYFTVGYSVPQTKGAGLVRNAYVHRLVATAWLYNPNNLPNVNHKDGDRTNNHVSNLEWCTDSHNMKHAVENNLAWNLPKKGQQGFRSKT